MTLLRELVLATAELPVNYDETGPDGALVCLIADRIARMRQAPLTVPLPRDPRLLKIARALHADPGDTRNLDEWGHQVGATRRTLSRLFRQDTGLSFTEWRQAVRLLASCRCRCGRADRRGGRATGLRLDVVVHRAVPGEIT